MNRAERRRAAREGRSTFRGLAGDEVCDNCGRHLDDGPPDLPTFSVEFGPGRMLFACGYCAPGLRLVVNELAHGR